jgi:hypothetical protein
MKILITILGFLNGGYMLLDGLFVIFLLQRVTQKFFYFQLSLD